MIFRFHRPEPAVSCSGRTDLVAGARDLASGRHLRAAQVWTFFSNLGNNLILDKLMYVPAIKSKTRKRR